MLLCLRHLYRQIKQTSQVALKSFQLYSVLVFMNEIVFVSDSHNLVSSLITLITEMTFHLVIHS